MSLIDKNQEKNRVAVGGTSRGTDQRDAVPMKERGKTIYNGHDRFEWNSVYVKQNHLEKRRIQTNGLDPLSLGDTVSLIKLEEESVLQPGYNPYDSGLSAMKQSRKPAELQDLSKHNTHLRKFGK